MLASDFVVLNLVLETRRVSVPKERDESTENGRAFLELLVKKKETFF